MPSTRSLATSPSARSGWKTLHRWLGLSLGTWFALVGLSGATLVFEDAIDAWLNPALLTSASYGPLLGPQTIVEKAQALYPLGHVEKIRFPAASGEVYRITLRVDSRRVGAHRAEIAIDPVSGTYLGSRSLETLGVAPHDAMRTLYEFHRNVLLGSVGSNIVGMAGALLLTSAVTGFVVAIPRHRSGWRRLIQVKRRAGMTRVLFDLHRSLGSTLCLLLLLATITGITLVYLNYVRDLVAVFSPVAPFPTVPWRQTPFGQAPSLREIHERVSRAYPGRSVAEIHVPSKPTAGYLIYLRSGGDVHRLGDTIVWIHPGNGEVPFERSARRRTSGESLMHWLFPLHSGTAFGLPGRIAMCATGVAPFVLVLTGLWVWSRKRRSERIETGRRALPGQHASPAGVRHAPLLSRDAHLREQR